MQCSKHDHRNIISLRITQFAIDERKPSHEIVDTLRGVSGDARALEGGSTGGKKCVKKSAKSGEKSARADEQMSPHFDVTGHTNSDCPVESDGQVPG